MFYLPLSLKASGGKQFQLVFQQEIKTIDPELLPLQQGLQYSSYAITDNLTVTVLNYKEDENELLVKSALFYTGIIAGCNCADDPTPVDEINEYCEVLFTIDKKTARCTVTLTD